jgi:2-methylcitrate dehydratase PrpD
MTVLGQLAEYLAMAPARTLSPPTRQRLATHVLDTIGSWMAGRATEEGFKLSRLTSGSPTGTSLLSNNPLDRITLGVATIRLTESDDIHMASCTTPSSVIVPTCLTIAAQSETPNVENFARGLRAGYEIMTRFGVAIDGPHIVYRGVWPTFFLAPIASAAVTAGILGFDTSKTANALALALSLTSGALGAPSGLSPRWLLLGLAARNGCAAALMAAEGYAGDQTLLDGDWLSRTHGVSCDVAQLSPSAWVSEATDTISLKPYTAAKQCISAIEAFRNLLKQGVQPEEIAAVSVHVPSVYAAMIAHEHAADGRIPRITSAAYNLALVAYRPNELYDVSRSDLTTDTEIAAFMSRIRVFPDDELSNYYPGCWPARVDAELKSGRIISNTLLDAPGDPANVVGWTGPLDKFHRIADEIVGRCRSMELASACLGSTERNESLQQLCKWSSDCNWP